MADTTDKHSRSITEILHKMKNINYWSLISGMTPAEVYLLGAICDENSPKRKVSDFYDACDMQPTAVSRLMNSLEEKGMIVRNTRRDNRRVIDVAATELGEITNRENRIIIQAYWKQVLENISEDDIETMLRVLDEVKDSMETVLEEKLDNREKENH